MYIYTLIYQACAINESSTLLKLVHTGNNDHVLHHEANPASCSKIEDVDKQGKKHRDIARLRARPDNLSISSVRCSMIIVQLQAYNFSSQQCFWHCGFNSVSVVGYEKPGLVSKHVRVSYPLDFLATWVF